MNSKSRLGIELFLRGVWITFPLIVLRGLFLRTFDRLLAHMILFLDVIIVLGFLLMAGGVGTMIWNVVRARNQRH